MDEDTYMCRCAYCEQIFYGYKRDVICPDCRVKPNTAGREAPSHLTYTQPREEG